MHIAMWNTSTKRLLSALLACVLIVAMLLTAIPLMTSSKVSAAEPTFIAIAAGNKHSLALDNNGNIWSWGDNTYGTLGDGTNIDSYGLVKVSGEGGFGDLSDIIAISAGDQYSLALDNNGNVWAWGLNEWGKLGDGTMLSRNTPVKVVGNAGGYLSGIIAIAAGSRHSLALDNNGNVWAWGINSDGSLGVGNFNVSSSSSTPVKVVGEGGIGFLDNIKAIAVGGNSSFALDNNNYVWAWGYNGLLGNGFLGDGTDTRRSAPVLVSGVGGTGYLGSVASISTKGFHTLALQNGMVCAWGYNGFTNIGDGTSTHRNTPVMVKSEDGLGVLGDTYLISAISAGDLHSLALDSNGNVWTWGYGLYGQLGIGTDTNRSIPVKVKGEGGVGFLSDIIAIASGDFHSLALDSSGNLWVWGYNGEGQLGDGTTVNRFTPVKMCRVPQITTLSLPGRWIGTVYNERLEATGNGNMVWTLESGALPSGLSLSSAGVISGTPMESGTFNFIVKATNGAGSDTKALSITVIQSTATVTATSTVIAPTVTNTVTVTAPPTTTTTTAIVTNTATVTNTVTAPAITNTTTLPAVTATSTVTNTSTVTTTVPGELREVEKTITTTKTETISKLIWWPFIPAAVFGLLFIVMVVMRTKKA